MTYVRREYSYCAFCCVNDNIYICKYDSLYEPKEDQNLSVGAILKWVKRSI